MQGPIEFFGVDLQHKKLELKASEQGTPPVPILYEAVFGAFIKRGNASPSLTHSTTGRPLR